MMIRTFAASTLAAVTMARGTGDGTSRANANELELVNDTDDKGIAVTLYSYMEYVNGIDYYNLELEYKNISANYSSINNIEYGYCVNMEQNKWECTALRTNIHNDGQSPEWGQTFEKYTLYLDYDPFFGFERALDNSYDYMAFNTNFWEFVPKNSSKECTTLTSFGEQH